MPTLPSTVPHSQAPYSASPRARIGGVAPQAGKPRASAAMPSSAIRLITGLASTAYKPSAACAMA